MERQSKLRASLSFRNWAGEGFPFPAFGVEMSISKQGNDSLRPFLAESGSDAPGADFIGNPRSLGSHGYAYSDQSFDLWFKVGDYWVLSGESSFEKGIRFVWPEGSTSVYFQSKKDSQIILGFEQESRKSSVEDA